MEPLNQNQFSNQYYDGVNDRCCCFNMRKITRAVTQLFDHCLEGAGIRSTQFTLLVALSSTKAKTLTEIADSLVMDRTTLTRNLKPLERSGYISSLPTADRRSKAYCLTERGREVVNRAMPLWESAQDNIVNMLSEERYNNLLQELEKLLSISSAAIKK